MTYKFSILAYIMKTREDIVKAIKEGDMEILQEFIAQAEQTQINEQDDDGNTLLHIAVEYLCRQYNLTRNVPQNATEAILLLVKHVNRRQRNGEEKLAAQVLWECEATFEEESKMIPVLEALLTEEHIEEECDVSVDEWCVLHDAVKSEAWDIVRMLVKKGVDITIEHNICDTALSWLAYISDVPDDIVQKLSHPETINRCDDFGYTPVMRAAVEGNSRTIKQLINNGADVTKNRGSNTALTLAIINNAKLSVEALRALIHPSIVNHNSSYQRWETALHKAASHGNVAAIEELLEAGADVNVKCFFGQKPIDKYTCDCTHIESAVVEKLLPSNGEDRSEALIAAAHRWFTHPPQIIEDAIDTISILLLRTGRDDFFRTHRIRHVGNGTLQLSLYDGPLEFNSNVTRFDFFWICLLVRKGIGSRTRPDIANAVLVDFDSSSIELKQARKMEALWNNPNSLSELCCFAIRDNLNNPTSRHQVHKLGLPKAIEECVLFRGVAREFCKALYRRGPVT